MNFLKNPLIFALDVDNREEAFKILDQVGPLLGCVKLGPRLVYRYGAELVSEVSKISPVFVDNKYFDIPSTMIAAVRASFEAGASLVTVHALAGGEALRALYALETELNNIRPFKVLAVTILTSWDKATIPVNLKDWALEDHVKSLAEDVFQSGLRGLVCSGHELTSLQNYHGMFKVVPGIRLRNESAVRSNEDQKRTMTPKEALISGASALVVGRPILQSRSPLDTVKEILESCEI